MIVFEALPAKWGDCLVLRFTGDGQERLWLVDGGPAGVYGASLKPRLDALRGTNERLGVDLAMISHIDDDHINGMLQLLSKLREAQDDRVVPFLDIKRFWFNSFSALVGTMPAALAAAARLVANGDPALAAMLPGLRPETGAVLASVGQGDKVTAEIKSLRIPLNEQTGRPIAAPQALTLNGATVKVLGPLQGRLDDLQRSWAKEAKGAATPADLAGLFREDLDTSVPNLSSIVVMVEIDGRRILLTGDARGDDVVAGWKALHGGDDTPVEVDIVKLPHHGSDRDLTEDFVRLFPARHYVVSANGKYRNPDPGSLQALVEALGPRRYTIHVTGPMLDYAANPTNPPPTTRVEQQLETLRPGRNFDYVVGQPVSIALAP